MQNKYDQYLKQSPENLQSQPEIKRFLKSNKENIAKFLDYKMYNIAKRSKIASSDAKDTLMLVRKKCFEDSDISFLNKIDLNGKCDIDV